MAKASLLKRIASLEQQAMLSARPPLLLVDLSTLTPDEVETYWTEASAVSTNPSLGYIHTIIVDVHETSRSDLQDGLDLDDEQWEATERRRERQVLRQQASEREQAQLQAIAVAAVHLPPVPANAYSIDDE